MTVLVAYVNRPEGEAAVDAAVVEARKRQCRLVVVRSMEGEHHEKEEDLRANVLALRGLEERLAATGADFEIHDLVRGNTPAVDVVEAVDRFDAQILVIGVRRRSLVGKLLLGSNATDILFDAPCPVLVVKVGQTHT